jgi:hypothetical protein
VIVEIRTYRLRAGSAPEFERLVRESAGPLLAQFGLDVVRHGPSVVDDDHYVLIRCFDSIDERDRQEATFYGSDEWRSGPRAAVLDLIENYHEVVLDLPPQAVDVLRT